MDRHPRDPHACARLGGCWFRQSAALRRVNHAVLLGFTQCVAVTVTHDGSIRVPPHESSASLPSMFTARESCTKKGVWDVRASVPPTTCTPTDPGSDRAGSWGGGLRAPTESHERRHSKQARRQRTRSQRQAGPSSPPSVSHGARQSHTLPNTRHDKARPPPGKTHMWWDQRCWPTR